jgi:hypothetical protein
MRRSNVPLNRGVRIANAYHAGVARLTMKR